ncbi:NADH dehydrogenase subunit 5 (mitochondrion) [Halyomorpha halys]|uniref:NADH-ubiquinone oxidoreductase chain 5 n=1 Tax=Halyomorpha halys TaxID=286706 RepID=C8YQC5_HALHY|nr:NADH dehydrogenase subunit 5 [Halyomorpha halys]ACM79580.1 NADH dehydrogenase subunit 5 [Halyomorpha halys]
MFINFYKYWSLILLLISLLLFYFGLIFLLNNYSLFLDWELISFNSVSVTMSMYLDWMSFIFMGGVLCISSMVILYSSSYMNADLFKLRFLFIVLLFVLSMMFLIISPNLVSILLGWDGLGLVSYCLVIYYQNFKSYNAGMLTILSNRIGDVFILIGISWLFNMGSWNYIYYLSFMDNEISLWLVYLLTLSAFTKSAQIPFSSWLPAAMAAPTPVSALVHSSTLVTAGVYLLIRFSELLNYFNMSFFLLISCLTMFMSGLAANFEYDLKSIIALSTLSQLGLMMSVLFMGYYTISYFHMLSHAFFKALMFLCAGIIIHSMNDSQDIRHMGNLINCLPYTCSCFCISNLSLCGFPFLSGFYSKDLILEYLMFNYSNIYIFLLFYISIGLTVSYSFRLIYFCFSGYNGLMTYSNFFEDNLMLYSLLLLTFLSVVGGSLLFWLIFPYPIFVCFPIFMKLLPLIFILLGSWIGYIMTLMSIYDNIFGLIFNYTIEFFSYMWFMPFFSTYLIYNNSLFFSKVSSSFMDSSWGEFLISNSFLNLINYFNSFYSIYQMNNVKIYLVSFMIIFFFMMFV